MNPNIGSIHECSRLPANSIDKGIVIGQILLIWTRIRDFLYSSDAGRSIVILAVPVSLTRPPHPLDAVGRGEYRATTNR